MSDADAATTELAPARRDGERMTIGLLLAVAATLVVMAGALAAVARWSRTNAIRWEMLGTAAMLGFIIVVALALTAWVIWRARGDRRLGPLRATASPARVRPGGALRVRLERTARATARVRAVEVRLLARDLRADDYLGAPLFSAVHRDETGRTFAAGEAIVTEATFAIADDAPAPSELVRWTLDVVTALSDAASDRRTFDLA